MSKPKRVAIALIKDHRDNILFGLRSDSGKFTNPGGHVEDGEDAYCGCVREVKEETGLDVVDIKLAKVSWVTKKKLMVYVFDVKVDPNQEIDPSEDPDKECSIWAYIDPNDIIDQLHVPAEDNILLQYWANS